MVQAGTLNFEIHIEGNLEHANLQFAKLVNLQLNVIGISDKVTYIIA